MDTRPATKDDLPEIVTIFSSCWPADKDDIPRLTTHFNRYRQNITDKSCDTIVAHTRANKDDVKGFVDYFFTKSSDGLVRLEIDLLAIHPGSRRQGIASVLIKAVERLGQCRSPCLARVVVHTDNAAMTALIEQLAYKPSEPHYLHIKHVTPAVKRVEWVLSPGLIQVHTMRYSGVWVEACISEECLRRAEQGVSSLGLDLVGALINVQDSSANSIAKQQGYMEVGVYRYWEKRI